MHRLTGSSIGFGFPTEAPSEEGVWGRVGPEYAAKGRELQRSDLKMRVENVGTFKVYNRGKFLVSPQRLFLRLQTLLQTCILFAKPTSLPPLRRS